MLRPPDFEAPECLIKGWGRVQGRRAAGVRFGVKTNLQGTARWAALLGLIIVGLAVLYRYGPSRENEKMALDHPGPQKPAKEVAQTRRET